jgi:hypothetical protein
MADSGYTVTLAYSGAFCSLLALVAKSGAFTCMDHSSGDPCFWDGHIYLDRRLFPLAK